MHAEYVDGKTKCSVTIESLSVVLVLNNILLSTAEKICNRIAKSKKRGLSLIN